MDLIPVYFMFGTAILISIMGALSYDQPVFGIVGAWLQRLIDG
jgi:hypothetical protein